jgi:hypothetical protein
MYEEFKNIPNNERTSPTFDPNLYLPYCYLQVTDPENYDNK